jgi:anti-sigma factor RsiW
MRECVSVSALAAAYVDSALGSAEREFVDRHLDSCAACRVRIGAERAVHGLLEGRRPRLQEERAPASLRLRCAASAGSLTAPRGGVTWARRVAPAALAASLVLLAGGVALYWATRVSPRVLAAELTLDHMKCFIVNRLAGLERGEGDQLAVEQSLASAFGWPAHLPERPDEAGLELVGARPCLYGEGRVAHVMYRHQGRPVSVFMLPDRQRAEDLIEVLGHEAAIWSAGDRTFVVVAREAPADVRRIVSFVHASIR